MLLLRQQWNMALIQVSRRAKAMRRSRRFAQNGAADPVEDRRGSIVFGGGCVRFIAMLGSVGGEVRSYIAVVGLLVFVATFAVGQKTPLTQTQEPFHLVLNDMLSLQLGMGRDALPKATPERELRCTVPVTDHTVCKLTILDQVTIAGARVLDAEFLLEKNRVTKIVFELDSSYMGLTPLLFSLQKQFGQQLGTLPLLCWQNPVSSVLFFAGEEPNIISMSLSAGCLQYVSPPRKE